MSWEAKVFFASSRDLPDACKRNRPRRPSPDAIHWLGYFSEILILLRLAASSTPALVPRSAITTPVSFLK